MPSSYKMKSYIISNNRLGWQKLKSSLSCVVITCSSCSKFSKYCQTFLNRSLNNTVRSFSGKALCFKMLILFSHKRSSSLVRNISFQTPQNSLLVAVVPYLASLEDKANVRLEYKYKLRIPSSCWFLRCCSMAFSTGSFILGDLHSIMTIGIPLINSTISGR